MRDTHESSSEGTLVDAFKKHVSDRGPQTLYTFLPDGGEREEHVSFRGLDARAETLAASLLERGARGQPVLLFYPSGTEYIAAFLGCLYASAIAVPAYPPEPSRLAKTLPRLQAIASDSGARLVLTTSDILQILPGLREQAKDLAALTWIASDRIETKDHALTLAPPAASDIAFLQYTSGSTGTPKGVIVTHGNIMANQRMIQGAMRTSTESIVVGWLPIYHDMGLIGNVLHPLFLGARAVLMPPTAFLQSPLRWLRAISKYRATTSGGPNFAYELCVHKALAKPADMDRWSLGQWTCAFNGAEPVRNDTLDEFARTFASCGFRASSFLPCYGLAESTLMVTGNVVDHVGVLKTEETEPSRELVSCGKPVEGLDVRIVDPQTFRACDDSGVGEIWVSGPAVAQGYWNKPEETQATFGARLDNGRTYLRTGDLGMMNQGELYVAGRLKDLIIVRGRNHYPQDIERSVERASRHIRRSCVAAFSVDVASAEELVIAFETKARGEDLEQVFESLRAVIAQEHDLSVHALVALAQGTIPKTSSGKIRRRATRQGYLEGTLEVIGTWPVNVSLKPSVITPAPKAPPTLATDATRASSPNAAALRAWLVTELTSRLKVSGALDADTPLAHYGLDSKTAVELSGELGERVGRDLPAALLYEHPTVSDIVRFLCETGSTPNVPAAIESIGDAAYPRYEPIAIVGLGCRMPGADNPRAFWQLIADGTEAVGEIPPSRWDVQAFYAEHGAPGKSITKRAALLSHMDEFDAKFFGISPREAKSMDPQHRLLLEVAWEAFENAQQNPQALAGTRTGIFVGMSASDYAQHHLRSGDVNKIDAYTGTGSAFSTAAGRISYLLGLQGPSIVVDTACSSSLVAIHLACQSLHSRESDMALAGGVSLVLSPEASVYLSTVGALAPDGLCKVFEESANGYGRGEGCGLVVLKRLDDALASGDPIIAVIRGSAVNQDGRSNGLTAPNATAQRAVIREALARARMNPTEVDYVETHGTGTALGDPIEATALGEVMRDYRDNDRPLYVGSVKRLIGHLEAAAGIAGLIKTALALHHELIPAQRVAAPTSKINWSGLKLALPPSNISWPRIDGRSRCAGISSFGMSGTNSHVILEHAPVPPQCQQSSVPVVLPLSAKSDVALRQLAGHFAEVLLQPNPPPLAEICGALVRGRAPLECRVACLGANALEISQELARFRDGIPSSQTLAGAVSAGKPRIAFLFTGQGSQYVGMGRELFTAEPVFRSALRRCDELLRAHLGESLLEVLYGEGDQTRIDATRYAQPALFSLQYALTLLWRSYGIEADIVVGHSVGEFAAACAAGLLSLEDALALVAARGRLMQELCAAGAMLAVDADGTLIRNMVELGRIPLDVAAINSPHSITVSGALAHIDAFAAWLSEQGIRFRKLSTSHAFHSSLMEPVQQPFGALCKQARFGSLDKTFISSVTGEVIEGAALGTSSYWTRQLRAPVEFSRAMATLQTFAPPVVIEIGPQPVLLGLHRRATVASAPVVRAASLTRDGNDWMQLRRSLAAVWTAGADVRWSRDEPPVAKTLFLPTYPFQRERYWIDSPHAARIAATPAERVPKQKPVLAVVSSRSQIAHKLQSIVAALLEVPVSEIGLHVPLPELGVDSMILVEGVQRIQQTFGIRLELREVFRSLTTLDLLAAHIERWSAVNATARQDEVSTPRSAAVTPPVAVPAATADELVAAAQAQLTKPQRRHLQTFQAAYVKRTSGSKQHQISSTPHLVDLRASSGFRTSFPVSQQAQWLNLKEIAYPIVGATSKGARLWDVDGNEYVDYTMGFGVHLFGHAAPFLVAAAQRQLERGTHIGPQAENAQEVARLISEITGVQRVAFCSSGTEAVMTALRVARAATGRSKVVLFAGSYHGSFDGVLGAIPMLHGSPSGIENDVIVLEYGNPTSLEVIRQRGEEIAAVLVEPVQGRRPELQPKSFLRELRGITQASGAALIFDEVLVGFRIDLRGAQAWFEVQADLVTYGKIVGGGMPIGVIAGSARYMDVIDGGRWSYGDASTPRVEQIWFAGTFNKSPLAMATARAALEHMKLAGPQLQTALNQKTAALGHELNAFFEHEGLPMQLVNFGSLFRFKVPRSAELFYHHLIHRGIYVWENRSCFLSTAHTDADVNCLIDAVKASALELRDAGFLPERNATTRTEPTALRLFCLPFAGGSASTYARWAASLPAEVEVVAVELPGHGVASGTALTEFEAVLDRLEADITPHLDGPFALFGHSMGALIAYELARRLQRRRLTPQMLYVSGEPAPHVPLESPRDSHELDDETLVKEMVRNGIRLESFDPALLREQILPMLRADLAVCASYRFAEGEPLACSITAFCGTQDELGPKARVRRWGELTTGDFALRSLAGGHFFIRTARTALLRLLSRDLHTVVAQWAADHSREQDDAADSVIELPLPGERAARAAAATLE